MYGKKSKHKVTHSAYSIKITYTYKKVIQNPKHEYKFTLELRVLKTNQVIFELSI